MANRIKTPVEPPKDEAKWLYVHSVVVTELVGRRVAKVKASEYHPNVEDGMSIFFYCDPWDTPKVGEYVGVDIKRVIPDVRPDAA